MSEVVSLDQWRQSTLYERCVRSLVGNPGGVEKRFIYHAGSAISGIVGIELKAYEQLEPKPAYLLKSIVCLALTAEPRENIRYMPGQPEMHFTSDTKIVIHENDQIDWSSRHIEELQPGTLTRSHEFADPIGNHEIYAQDIIVYRSLANSLLTAVRTCDPNHINPRAFLTYDAAKVINNYTAK